jgi:hypothetical protein
MRSRLTASVEEDLTDKRALVPQGPRVLGAYSLFPTGAVASSSSGHRLGRIRQERLSLHLTWLH